METPVKDTKSGPKPPAAKRKPKPKAKATPAANPPATPSTPPSPVDAIVPPELGQRQPGKRGAPSNWDTQQAQLAENTRTVVQRLLDDQAALTAQLSEAQTQLALERDEKEGAKATLAELQTAAEASEGQQKHTDWLQAWATNVVCQITRLTGLEPMDFAVEREDGLPVTEWRDNVLHYRVSPENKGLTISTAGMSKRTFTLGEQGLTVEAVEGLAFRHTLLPEVLRGRLPRHLQDGQMFPQRPITYHELKVQRPTERMPFALGVPLLPTLEPPYWKPSE